jgi:hypothetical protein
MASTLTPAVVAARRSLPIAMRSRPIRVAPTMTAAMTKNSKVTRLRMEKIAAIGLR